MKLIFCVLVRCKWKSVQWMERTDQMTFFIPQCIRSMDSDLIWNSINIRRIHQIRLKKWSSWQRNNRLCKWGGWKAFQSGRNWHILSPGGERRFHWPTAAMTTDSAIGWRMNEPLNFGAKIRLEMENGIPEFMIRPIIRENPCAGWVAYTTPPGGCLSL